MVSESDEAQEKIKKARVSVVKRSFIWLIKRISKESRERNQKGNNRTSLHEVSKFRDFEQRTRVVF